jgi:hypothetical protein
MQFRKYFVLMVVSCVDCPYVLGLTHVHLRNLQKALVVAKVVSV